MTIRNESGNREERVRIGLGMGEEIMEEMTVLITFEIKSKTT